MIKLADKNDGGWLVVEEYQSDDLADDSEDDKRIRKAQANAARKKKQIIQASNKRQRTSNRNRNAMRNEDSQFFRGKPLSRKLSLWNSNRENEIIFSYCLQAWRGTSWAREQRLYIDTFAR